MLDGLMSRCSTPGAVRGFDRAADLDRDAQHLGDGQLLPAIALAERRGTQLHHEVGAAIGGDAGLVHGEDRRVGAQLGHQVRLGLEHLANVVVDHLAQHDLHRDLAPGHVLLVEEDIGETRRNRARARAKSRAAREAAMAVFSPLLPPRSSSRNSCNRAASHARQAQCSILGTGYPCYQRQMRLMTGLFTPLLGVDLPVRIATRERRRRRR